MYKIFLIIFPALFVNAAQASIVTVDGCSIKEESYFKGSVPPMYNYESNLTLPVAMTSTNPSAVAGQKYIGKQPLLVRYQNLSNASANIELTVDSRSVVISASVISSEGVPQKVIMSGKSESPLNTFASSVSTTTRLMLENPIAMNLKLGQPSSKSLLENPNLPTDVDFHAALEITCGLTYRR